MNIKALREELGWSQQKLADAAGISRSLVSRLESGDAQPSINVLVTLATVLHADLNTLKNRNPFVWGQGPAADSAPERGRGARLLHRRLQAILARAEQRGKEQAQDVAELQKLVAELLPLL